MFSAAAQACGPERHWPLIMPAYFLDGSTNTLREKAQMRAKISIGLCEGGITRQLEPREQPSVKGPQWQGGLWRHSIRSSATGHPGSCILCVDSTIVCDLPPLFGPFSSCFFLLPKIISCIMIFFNLKPCLRFCCQKPNLGLLIVNGVGRKIPA